VRNRIDVKDKSPTVALATKRKENFPAALILAGGLGTRLRSAFAAGPKSLAPVAGRPFLDYLLKWLRAEGVEEVVLCVGYKKSHIERHVGSGRKWGLRVRYSRERRLLGTGGAVKKGGRMTRDGAMFVVNGDTFLDVDLKKLRAFHKDRKALATLAVARVEDDGRFGAIRLDRKGRLTAFLEKSGKDANGAPSEVQKLEINGGVYLFEKKLLNRIPTQKQVSLEKDVFPDLISKHKVFGFVTDGYFLDIGVPDDFRRAQVDLPERFGVGDTH
jgi:NDP-sugar pyrophosphorylase family protein